MLSDKIKNFAELPFIGRNNELKILQEILQLAFNYQGKCVVISGEPGMGKTRLVEEFLKNIQYNLIYFNIQIKPNTSANSLFLDIIKNYLHRTGRPVREIVQVIGEEIYNNYAETIPSLKVYFPYQPLPKKTEFFEIPHYFVEFIERLSGFSFVIFILEEIQNAENDVFILLNQILNQLDRMPVLMILTTDNSNIIDKLQSKNLIKIMLENIDKEEVLKLNEIIFANSLEVKFFDWLFKRTNGNPLFLREYIITLIEKGVIYYNYNSNLEKKWCTLPNYHKIPVFKGIPDILKLRFAGLSNKEIKFLETASIIGEKFSPAILKVETDLLHNLIRRGLIKKEQENYVFSHPLIREIIYNNIADDKKINMHKRIGELFEEKNDILNALTHFEKAQIYKDWMVDYLLRIANESEELRDFVRASKFLDQALNIARKIKKIANKKLLNILARNTRIKLKIGVYNDAIESAEKYLKTYADIKSTSKKQTLDVYSTLINALVRAGKYNEAITTADKVLSQLKKLKINADSNLIFDIMTTKAFALKYLGELDKAMDIGLQLKSKFNKNTSLIARYYIYNLLGSVFNTIGDYPKAIEYRIQTLQITEEIGSPSLIASAQGNLGISYINNCEFEKGRKYLLQHREYSIKSGMIREQIMACLNLGACYLFQGYLEQAIEEFEDGIALCKETNNETDIVWILKYYGIALLFKEEYRKAVDSFNTGSEIAKKKNNFKLWFTISVYKGLVSYILNYLNDLNSIIIELDKETGKIKNDNSLYLLLKALSLDNYSKKMFSIINRALKLAENKKDYPEFLFILYFCIKFLKNNPHRTVHLNNAKLIAQKFHMTGWLEKLAPENRKTTQRSLKILTLGRLNIQSQESKFVATKLMNWQKLRDFFSILIISKIKAKRLTREEMGTFLWPELSKKQVVNNFHVCLSELKKIFGKDYFCYENGTYTLNNVWIDAVEFFDLINDAQNLYSQGKIHTAEEKLEKAISLYKGTFLDDCYGRWVDETREKIYRIYRQALFLLSDIYLKKLRFNMVIETLQKILILDPLDEEAHRFLMKAYLFSNEKAKAIEQYKKCVELFKKEYDCQPSEETIRLYEEIKKQ